MILEPNNENVTSKVAEAEAEASVPYEGKTVGAPPPAYTYKAHPYCSLILHRCTPHLTNHQLPPRRLGQQLKVQNPPTMYSLTEITARLKEVTSSYVIPSSSVPGTTELSDLGSIHQYSVVIATSASCWAIGGRKEEFAPPIEARSNRR